MQTICTKFLGATATKPMRIVATSSGGRYRLVQSVNGEYGQEQIHQVAAQALKDKLGWSGRMIGEIRRRVWYLCLQRDQD